jgi:hypothetical protein
MVKFGMFSKFGILRLEKSGNPAHGAFSIPLSLLFPQCFAQSQSKCLLLFKNSSMVKIVGSNLARV